MGETTILVTLLVLLDFFRSKIHNKYPKYNENIFDKANLRRNNRESERKKLKTVLREYLQCEYTECILPEDLKLSNSVKSLIKSGESQLKLQLKTAETDDSDYTCEGCSELKKELEAERAENAKLKKS